MNKYKEKELAKIINKLGDKISNENDLLAGEEPTLMFFFLINKLGYLLENDPDKVISKKGIELRKKINVLFKKVGPLTLRNPQIFEDKDNLLPNDPLKGTKVNTEGRPIIYVSNHAFKDDTLATILAADRNAYILFGSLPQFYNTIDGLTAWINGSIVTNRKVKSSKKASVPKAVKTLKSGGNILMFPEGVWNKTPNKLLLDFWPGLYIMARESNALIVPIVHYIKDTVEPGKENPIHTIVDYPIDINNMTDEEANKFLRERMGTWFYLMLEKYGKDTRKNMLNGFDTSKEAWDDALTKRVGTTTRYDNEIERCADYIPKGKVNIEDVYGPIADIEIITKENAKAVAEAKKLVKIDKENNFQRRF